MSSVGVCTVHQLIGHCLIPLGSLTHYTHYINATNFRLFIFISTVTIYLRSDRTSIRPIIKIYQFIGPDGLKELAIRENLSIIRCDNSYFSHRIIREYRMYNYKIKWMRTGSCPPDSNEYEKNYSKIACR